jgi:lipopolysaccharide transport system ATP-binding protein
MVVIEAEHISKKYIIRHEQAERYKTLSGALTNLAKSVRQSSKEEFWALNDISFEIKQGERVGIIGRNGAGKSTLLKVLSRIVTPTSGRVEITGRVASLLEVGTGFHPELSGRENIFLNGSILGMSKREIQSKFDEIVDFAEVEKFLDTPVKRYSSGMYVRLAFAVAAHLEPEILIVDEVLAVGDAAFQKKCLGKMKDVTGQGRTLLFVSHNMAAIQNLCSTCLYMKGGSLITQGKTEDVIPIYLRASLDTQHTEIADRSDRSGSGAVRFLSFTLRDSEGKTVHTAQCGEVCHIDIGFKAKSDLSNLSIAVGVDDDFGQRVAHFSNETTGQLFEKVGMNDSTVRLTIPHMPLKRGVYSVTLFASTNGEIADWIQEAAVLNVEDGDFFRTGKLPPDGQASVLIDHSFVLK